MLMRSKERWHCVNPACRCSVVVETSGEIEGQNPVCVCGSILKKDYSAPVFRYLDFLRMAERALIHTRSRQD